MEIIWYGHSCFRLKDRSSTIITDPFNKTLGLSLPRLTADIVTISNSSPHHNYVAAVKGDFTVLDGPGEYEIGGIFINGIRILPPQKNGGAATKNKQNNVFVFYMDSIAIGHLGDLVHVPNQSQIEEMGNIDVLLIPVAGEKALSAAQAAEVISLIEPYIVIPMHYDIPGLNIKLESVDKFLKEMGITNTKTESALRITSTSLPEETQIVLLEPRVS